MVNQKYIVVTRDVFLHHSIGALMKHLPCESKMCFIDVDSFRSIVDLHSELNALVKTDAMRALLISRGLWLSRVTTSLIDLHMSDDVNKWRYCIISAKIKSLANIIEKIEGIKRLEGLNPGEVRTICSLQAENNIVAAARKAGVNYKSFLRRTLLIARKFNLKNTTDLHYFMHHFYK